MDFAIPKHFIGGATWPPNETITMHQHMYVDNHAEIHGNTGAHPDIQPNYPDPPNTTGLGHKHKYQQVMSVNKVVRKRKPQKAKKHGGQKKPRNIWATQGSGSKQISRCSYQCRWQNERRSDQSYQAGPNSNESIAQHMLKPGTPATNQDTAISYKGTNSINICP